MADYKKPYNRGYLETPRFQQQYLPPPIQHSYEGVTRQPMTPEEIALAQAKQDALASGAVQTRFSSFQRPVSTSPDRSLQQGLIPPRAGGPINPQPFQQPVRPGGLTPTMGADGQGIWGPTPNPDLQLAYTAVMPPPGFKYVYNQRTGERRTVPLEFGGPQLKQPVAPGGSPFTRGLTPSVATNPVTMALSQLRGGGMSNNLSVVLMALRRALGGGGE